MNYQPGAKILQRYANVLVSYALNSGKGVKPKEVVFCYVPDVAKPLALVLQNTLLRAGAQPLIMFEPTLFAKDFFRLANQDQLQFFPKKYLKERVNLADHSIAIIADVDPLELETINPKKIILKRDSAKAYRDWMDAKETQGKFTWTVGLWPTPAKAKLVGLSLKAYWQQLIKACFLDKAEPIKQWKKIAVIQQRILNKLNALNIQSVNIKGKEVDLNIQIGSNRRWMGGSGRNIPSFEIFTAPDWRGCEGWMRFNQPIYRYGNVIKDIYLELRQGLVVEAKAKVGQKLLTAMLKSKNADKLGEFSLTDKRLSRIKHIMAEILFDENIAGRFGNCHVALGRSYQDCYRGDGRKLTSRAWEKLGFNNSAEHTDFISTTNRTVTARLADGREKVIYQHGQFTL